MVASEVVEEAIVELLSRNGYRVSVKDVEERTLKGGISRARLIHGVKNSSVFMARISGGIIKLTLVIKHQLDDERASSLEEKGWRVDVAEDETIVTLKVENAMDASSLGELIQEAIA
ncbi:hypothetical protein [Desulfurococcus mucosus]|uniref:Uncharacterized protein n=1 Tax=Desulfurococcus mucosus (strain ATCC 35584 / DSM 2162 / JCM 9187 / O7/1) TaxID=765177 RepID=E8R9K0_DESM0|nr:hypothetical protein [Desulfurococcus mucosus]ADV65176.1 hypothetical protein Desmu_0872 [Desulfurococcus mucosus DSM 2162]